MRVMFVMRDKGEGFVRYGEKEGRVEGWRKVGTVVGRYEREDMCDAPANESVGWRDPGWVHDGVMTGLKNGKRYYYQVLLTPFNLSVPVLEFSILFWDIP